MKSVLLLACLLLVLALAGCRDSETVAPVAPPSTPLEPSVPSSAQPRLPALKLWLGSEELNTEVAITPRQVQTGMMFRTNMVENEAMLFIFGSPHRASFWMKNTSVPLSAAYINPDGMILEIHDLHPHDTNTVTADSDQVQYVLETNQGWFGRKNIAPGTVIRTEMGSFRETFFANRQR